MFRTCPLPILLAAVAVTCTATPFTISAQGFTWVNATELSFVATAGNSSSSTLGLKTGLTGTSEGSEFKFSVGGIRAESEFRTTTAVGTEADFTVNREIRTDRSAENYFAKGRYDHDVGSAFAFGGANWTRNTFAGVNHRFGFVAGFGRTWAEEEGRLFKTDIGATYTIQKDVEDDPAKRDGFGGVRANIEALRALTEATELATSIEIDENLRDTEDLRIDWVVSFGVALTEGLAFKTSYQLLFDNDPARVAVPLFDTGGAATGTVRIPTDTTDSYLTLSLVIKL